MAHERDPPLPRHDGERLRRGLRRAHPEAIFALYRKVISGGFNWAVALAWGKHFGDIGSLCMMRPALWKQIPTTSTSAFAQAERYIVAWRNGARRTTIPVEHLPCTTGKSSFESPRPALRALKDLIRFRLSGADRRELHPW